MEKKIINTNNAPAAVGTYSQGVIHNNLYFFSGQIGLDPQTSELKKTFSEQLEQILKNIEALCLSCKLTRENIIKTTIFMTDLNQFSEVNKAYENYFSKPYPARSTVQVSALPKNALIEIEVIAAI